MIVKRNRREDKAKYGEMAYKAKYDMDETCEGFDMYDPKWIPRVEMEDVEGSDDASSMMSL